MASPPAQPGFLLHVVHEDGAIVVVDKPAGSIVIPGRGAPERTLKQEAEARFGRLFVVHRLDRGTSGVLVFARTAEAHRTLNLAFDRREIEKRYLALVRGVPPPEQRIDLPLVPARRGRMRPARPGDPGAKPSATRVRLVEQLGPFALVEAEPETGRTHQIRIHLAQAGFPLAVDPDYGADEPLRDGSGAVLLERTPLHASSIAFVHPATGERFRCEAPLAEDMARAVAWARGVAAR